MHMEETIYYICAVELRGRFEYERQEYKYCLYTQHTLTLTVVDLNKLNVL